MEQKQQLKIPTTCLVRQEVVQGKRVRQSLSRKEPKNMLRQGLHSSDQPQVWWKDVYPQKSLSARHKIRWMFKYEDRLSPRKHAKKEVLLYSVA